MSKLSSRFLGFPLDKTLQCSDWNFRPLSIDQIHYASTDSYVLIELFNTLVNIGVKRIYDLPKSKLEKNATIQDINDLYKLSRIYLFEFPSIIANSEIIVDNLGVPKVNILEDIADYKKSNLKEYLMHKHLNKF